MVKIKALDCPDCFTCFEAGSRVAQTDFKLMTLPLSPNAEITA